MTYVEYCLNNVAGETRAALADVDCETRAAICLDRCGRCCDEPFLVVDGDVVDGADHADLLASLPAGDA